MSATPFAEAIEAVRRPLRFAAEGESAESQRLRNLEDSVARASLRVAALAIPPDARVIFEKIARRFASPLEGKARIAAVREALELIHPFLDPLVAHLPGRPSPGDPRRRGGRQTEGSSDPSA